MSTRPLRQSPLLVALLASLAFGLPDVARAEPTVTDAPAADPEVPEVPPDVPADPAPEPVPVPVPVPVPDRDAAPAPGAAATVPIPGAGHTDSRVGWGFDVGGGGILGFTTQIRVGPAGWVDLGLHGRVAITPGVADDHAAAALTLGYTQDLGLRSVRGAVFGVVGATLPTPGYQDAFLAAGPALRMWSRERRAVNTLAIGPGYLPIRRIEGAAPGPPFLIFLRYALHFHRADSMFRE